MSLKLVQTLKQYHFDGQRWHHVFPKHAKRRGRCQVIHCRRFARVEIIREKGKTRVSHRTTCPTCTCRLSRANNPARDAYRVIRERAQTRKQIFAITFEQFCAIPRFAEYLKNRGRGIHEMHLDRIKTWLGYVPGNLQVLTAAENLRKQREVDYAEGPF